MTHQKCASLSVPMQTLATQGVHPLIAAIHFVVTAAHNTTVTTPPAKNDSVGSVHPGALAVVVSPAQLITKSATGVHSLRVSIAATHATAVMNSSVSSVQTCVACAARLHRVAWLTVSARVAHVTAACVAIVTQGVPGALVSAAPTMPTAPARAPHASPNSAADAST